MKQPQASYLRPVRASGQGAVPVTAGKGACAGRSAGLQSRGDGSFFASGAHAVEQPIAPRLSGNLGNLLSLPRTACGTAQGRRSPSNPLAGGAPRGEAGTIIASVAERLSHLPVEQAPQRASQVRVLPDAPSFSGAGVSSDPLLNRQTHVAAALSGMPCGLAESVRRAPSGGAGSGATRDTGRGDFLIRRDDEAELSCMEPGGPGVVVAPAFTHPRRCSSSKRERRHLPLIPCQKPRRTTPGGTGGAGNPSSGDVR